MLKLTLYRKILVRTNSLKITGLVEVREKSSHYGLNMLGYTCATKANTMGSYGESRRKALKIVSVRIVDCNSFTWSRNR